MKQKLSVFFVFLLVVLGGKSQSLCDAPIQLQAISHLPEWNNVQISWQLPATTNEMTKSWCTNISNNYAGLGGSVDFIAAVRFTPEDLEDCAGLLLTSISFVPNIDPFFCTYSVEVWTGGSFSNNVFNPGTLVVDQPITSSLSISQLNTIDLVQPIAISSNEELWLGIKCNSIIANALGVSNNSLVDGKGNLLFANNSWTTSLQENLNNNGNWVIIGTFEAQSSPLVGFNIYRDNVVLNNTPYTSTTYLDSISEGTYHYEVSALYADGCESERAVVSVTMQNLPCSGCTDTAIVGLGTLEGYQLPINTYYEYSYTQQIYTAAEIGNRGNLIECIAFQYVNSMSQAKPIKVYMGNTQLTSFAQLTDMISVNDMALVFDGTITFAPSIDGWVNIPLQTPFVWDGSSNVVVAVVNNSGNYPSGEMPTFKYHNLIGSDFRTLYCARDFVPYTPETENYANEAISVLKRNNIRFMFGGSVSCGLPAYLSVVDLTHEEVTINWIRNDNADGYEVVCVPENQPISAGTIIQVTDTFCTISNLNPYTRYKVYVRANCSLANSDYVNITFTTQCLPIVQLPFVETFDEVATYPDCWQKLTTNTIYPLVTNAGSVNGSFLQLYASESDYSYAILPLLDTEVYPLNTLQVKFKAKKMAEAFGNIDVGVITQVDNPSSFVSIASIQPSDYQATNVWQNFVVRLSNFSGNQGYIAFRLPSGYVSYAYIDDVEVDEIVECTSPSNLTIVNSAATSAFLSWRASEYADSTEVYNVEYALQGTNMWQNITTQSTTCMLTGLQPNSIYEVMLYVECWGGRADTLYAEFTTLCFAGGDWQIGIGTASSECFPLNANFEYALTQQLFTAEELQGAQIFDGIKFYVTQSSNQSRNIEIYLGNTTQNVLNSFISTSYQTLVYSGAISLSQVGWVEIPFDSSFIYTGENLVLTVDDNTGFWGDMAQFAVHTGTSLYDYGDGTNFNPITTSSLLTSNYRNNVVFVSACDTISRCVKPTLYLSSVTETAISMFWASGNQEVAWELEYKSENDTLWISEGVVTQTSYFLSGLVSNTNYEIRLRSICGEDEFSAYAVLQVTTPCEPYATLPFVENFDGVPTNSFPDCWSKNTNASSLTYPSINGAMSVAQGGKSLYMYAGGTNNYAVAVLPKFSNDIEMDNLLIRFSMRAVSAAAVVEVGIMEDPSDVSTFETIATLGVETIHTWERKECYTRAYNGVGSYVAFRVPYGSTYVYYIDEISVDVIPECTYVDDLSVTTIDTSYVELTWTPGGLESEWEVVLLPSGSVDLDTITHTSIVYVPAYSESLLVPSTSYTFYVRALCSATETSDWKSITFMTNQPPATLPYVCDFEDTHPMWSFYNGTTENQWCIGTATSNGGTHSMYVSNNGGGANAYSFNRATTIWAYRDIYFPANALGYILSFDWRAVGESVGESAWDYMNVFLGDVVEINASNYTQCEAGFSGISRLNVNALNGQSSYQNFQIDIPGFSEGGVKRLYFAWQNDYVGGANPPASVDNISITEAICPIPTNVVVDNITTTSASISWTENGNSSVWMVYYKMDLDTVWQSQMTISTNHLLTGLVPDRNYMVRVAASCGTGQYSQPSSFVEFSTLPTCFAPTHLISTNNTNSTIDLTWTAGGTETAWIVAYKLHTDDWNAATEINVVNSNYTITGLTSNAYDIRVRALCSTTEQSQWSDVLTVIPGVFVLPIAGAYSLTTCDAVIVDNGGLEGDYASNVDVTLVLNPENPGDYIALSGSYVLETNFDNLSIFDGAEAVGVPQTYSGMGSLNVTSSTGPLTIRFVSDANSNFSGFALAVSCVPGTIIDSCYVPTQVGVIPAQHGVDVTWLAGGSETEWLVEHKLVTDENWISSAVVNVTSYNISGLMPNTNYQVRVKAICAQDNQSDWTAPISFTTLNETITTYIISASASGPGAIVPSGDVVVQEGDHALFSFIANENAVINQVLVDDVLVTPLDDNSYTFSNVVANHTIEVVFEEEPIGISDFTRDFFVKIFPNPASQYVKIQVQQEELYNANVELFDLYGRKMIDQKLDNDILQLNVSNYASGMYWVRISNENGVLMKNFIKK